MLNKFIFTFIFILTLAGCSNDGGGATQAAVRPNHAVTLSVVNGTGGTPGANAVAEGSSLVVTVVSNLGSSPGGYMVDTTCPSGTWSGPTYTSGAITGDCTLTISAPKMTFITSIHPTGNLGGIVGADAMCMADANKPDNGTYKAMISDASARVACTSANCATNGLAEHVDWVFAPNTYYAHPDGTLVAKTNSIGLLPIPTTGTLTASGFDSWTGMNADWTNGLNCNGWTSASSAVQASWAAPATNNQFIINAHVDCTNGGGAENIVCVAQ